MANPTYNGVEMPVFTLAPNWQAGEPTVPQEHQTIIREALDLSEERRRARPRALFGIAYEAMTLSAQETGYHRKVIEQAQAMPMGCPFWAHMTLLTADTAAGATELPVDNCNEFLFTSLKYALIMDRFDNWEVVEVTGVSSDGVTLTLAGPTIKDWTAAEDPFTGARVYPVMYGELKRASFTAINDEESTASIEFNQKQYFDFYQDEPLSPPDLTLVQSPCGELLYFSWTARIFGVAHYQLEANPDGAGWEVVAANLDGDIGGMTLSNPYSVAADWRLTAIGFADIPSSAPSVVVSAVAPEVALCDITLGGCTLLPYTGGDPTFVQPDRAVELTPVSVHENALVAQDETYLVIKDRYDFYIDQDRSGLYIASIDVTCPTPSATVLWTTDGSDPTIEGPNVQNLPQDEGFQSIVKARAWLDGCYSAMTVILIDKRVDIISSVTTQGRGQSVAGSCSGGTVSFYPVPDGLGGYVCSGPHVTLFGDSCALLEGGLEAHLKSAACGSLDPGAVSTTRQIVGFTSTVVVSPGFTTGDCNPGPSARDYALGGESSGSVDVFIADTASFSYHTDFWHAQPDDRTQVRAFVKADTLDIAQIVGFSGIAGDGVNMAVVINSFVRGACGDGERIYAPAQVILTKELGA